LDFSPSAQSLATSATANQILFGFIDGDWITMKETLKARIKPFALVEPTTLPLAGGLAATWSQLSESFQSCRITLFVIGLTLITSLSSMLTSAFEIHLQDQFGILQVLGCHLLHWSKEHLLWDLGMFAILGIVCERSYPKTFAMTLLACALVIPLCILFTNPDIDIYRGLSGIDTGLFALLATTILLRGLDEKDRTSAGVFGSLLILLWCKIGFEFYSGQVLFVQRVDFEPLPIAHAVGAIMGSAFSFLQNSGDPTNSPAKT
jgi:rhomboid family GlyGly-CTERM serine protease